MPWKKSKTVSGLITHYGRWTRQEENDFYSEISFEDWKGNSGVVPRIPKTKNIKPQELERNSDADH